MKKYLLILLIVVVLLISFAWFRWSIVADRKWGAQTIYLSILNCFHIQDDNAEAYFMLIDDDSGPGIFKIHEICERVGVKATFAVVPTFLDSTRCDSLKKWQLEGYGIALHGYDHGKWKDWSYDEIKEDIEKSLFFLKQNGFSRVEQIKLVVTPSFYNTRAIRQAIHEKRMKMVMGANIVNPDTLTFQWGRIFIKKDTDLDEIHRVLLRAKETNSFVVFGTHSSINEEFSPEKTETVLKMAKELLKNLHD